MRTQYTVKDNNDVDITGEVNIDAIIEATKICVEENLRGWHASLNKKKMKEFDAAIKRQSINISIAFDEWEIKTTPFDRRLLKEF